MQLHQHKKQPVRWRWTRPLVAAMGVLLLVGMIGLVPRASYAAYDTLFTTVNTLINFLFITPFGMLATILTGLLFSIAGAQVSFISMPAIVRAWIVVRDLSNMVFIFVLLAIAFGTVLGSSKFNYKRALPKLILMAILINFSRSICGLIIDFSQVVMLSFVEAMKGAGAGSLLTTLGINRLTNPVPASNIDNAKEQASGMTLVLILIAFMLSALCVTLLVWITMLLFRIAMLWFLIVMSPLAFAMNAVPGGEGKFNEWLKTLTNYAILGPLITFFLWLTLFIASYTANNTNLSQPVQNSYFTWGTSGSEQLDALKGLSPFEGADPNLIANFLVAIMMLYAGLKFTKGLAGEASGIIGKVEGRARKALGTYVKKAATYGAIGGAVAGGGVLGLGAAGTLGGVGVGLGLSKTPIGKNYLNRAKGWTQAAVGRYVPFMGTDLRQKGLTNLAKARKEWSERGKVDAMSLKNLAPRIRTKIMNAGVDTFDPVTGEPQYVANAAGANAKTLAKQSPHVLLETARMKKAAGPAVAKYVADAMKILDFQELDDAAFNDADFVAALGDRIDRLATSDVRDGRRLFDAVSAVGQGKLTAVGFARPYAQHSDEEEKETLTAYGVGARQADLVVERDKGGKLTDNRLVMADRELLEQRLGGKIGGRVIGDNVAMAITDPKMAKKIADEIQTIIEEGISYLDATDINSEDALRGSLRSFYGQAVENKSLGQLQQMAVQGRQGAMEIRDHLGASGEELVDKGFVLMDKNYAGQRGAVRNHEKTHTALQASGIQATDYQAMYDQMDTAEQQAMVAHLKPRADFASLQPTDMMEEYLADYYAGLVQETAAIDQLEQKVEQAIQKSNDVMKARAKIESFKRRMEQSRTAPSHRATS